MSSTGSGFSISLKKTKKSKKRKANAFAEDPVEEVNDASQDSLNDLFNKQPKKKQQQKILITEIDTSKDYLGERENENKEESRLVIQPSDLTSNEGQEETTLDEYSKIPVGQFGLALLRGMGYDDESETTDTDKLKKQNTAKSKFTPETIKNLKEKNSMLNQSNELFLPVVKKVRKKD